VAGLTPHWSAAPPEVVSAYREISGALRGTDFCLAGGTAVALRLGHRLSADLDLFSLSLEEVEPLLARLRAALPRFVLTSTSRRTLYGTVDDVQVSLFGYAYPWLQAPEEPAPGLLPICGLHDIAAMKLAAIASRGSRKDFVDLWFLSQAGIVLADALRLFQQKFAPVDIGHVVRSLIYFDEADLEPPLRLLRPAPWDAVKADFRRWVDELLAAP
jgi:hypothetical protein